MCTGTQHLHRIFLLAVNRKVQTMVIVGAMSRQGLFASSQFSDPSAQLQGGADRCCGSVYVQLQSIPKFLDVTMLQQWLHFRQLEIRACYALQGAMTEGRFPREATVQLAMTMGTSVGGEAGQMSRLFSSIDRAQEGVAELAGSSAAAAAQLYESTARVQALTGQVRPRITCCQNRSNLACSGIKGCGSVRNSCQCCCVIRHTPPIT